MFVTFEVLKFLKSKLVNDEQEENIYVMFVTFEVSTLLNVIVFNFVKRFAVVELENKKLEFAGK